MGARFYPSAMPDAKHDCQLHIDDANNPDSADGDASPASLTFSQDGDEAALFRVAFWNTEAGTAYRASLTFRDVGEYIDWATALLADGLSAFSALSKGDGDDGSTPAPLGVGGTNVGKDGLGFPRAVIADGVPAKAPDHSTEGR